MARKTASRLWDDPKIRRDLAFIHVCMEDQVVDELAAHPVDVSAFDVLKKDGALDRVLAACAHELEASDGSGERSRDVLREWLQTLQTYLVLHLPVSARPLFETPLGLLLRAFADLDRGIAPPVLQHATCRHRAPSSTDAIDFKVRCVLAAQELYDQSRRSGAVRLSRQEADDKVRARVRHRARSLGLTVGTNTIAGWRKAIREAASDDFLAVGHRVLKGVIETGRANHAADFWIEWLLAKMTKSPPYRSKEAFGEKPHS